MRTHVGEGLCVRNFLAGTEGVLLALTIKKTRKDWKTYYSWFYILSKW